MRSGGAVKLGIVDETFPSDYAARFFEIGSHDDGDFAFDGFREIGESPRVIHGCGEVVYGAGAADDQEAMVVLAGEDPFDFRAGAIDGLFGIGSSRNGVAELVRRGETDRTGRSVRYRRDVW